MPFIIIIMKLFCCHRKCQRKRD